MATREKLVLEDNQRAVHKELKEKAEEWKPKYFERDSMSENPHAWIYRYSEYVSDYLNSSANSPLSCNQIYIFIALCTGRLY